jgi:hypothetical protein
MDAGPTRARNSRRDPKKQLTMCVFEPTSKGGDGATGTSNSLVNGGTPETARALANHESARTTKPYDRRNEKLSLDEVGRITN